MPDPQQILAEHEAGDPGTSRAFAPWRQKLHEVIFEADTPAGKAFDIALLIAIIISTVAVMLESVHEIDRDYHFELRVAEWIITILFTIEYVLRLICVRRPGKYARSFFGIVDLVSILPTYIAVLLPGLGVQTLVIVRTLRLLRVFRIFKLGRFLSGAAELKQAVWASRAKVVVFLFTVMTVVCIMGSVMYLVEGMIYGNEGFENIPKSMYWAIVTMTTVGYGDVTPHSAIGQFLAAGIILFGYSLIIVPTGFVSAEIVYAREHPEEVEGEPSAPQTCPRCKLTGHDTDAAFCKRCGEPLAA